MLWSGAICSALALASLVINLRTSYLTHCGGMGQVPVLGAAILQTPLLFLVGFSFINHAIHLVALSAALAYSDRCLWNTNRLGWATRPIQMSETFMTENLAWFGFVLGGIVCAINFYLSFVRFAIHRWRGLQKDSYRWVSGFPMIGSLLVALSLLHFHSMPVMFAIGIGLIAADTGGIHWFIFTIIFHLVARKH